MTKPRKKKAGGANIKDSEFMMLNPERFIRCKGAELRRATREAEGSGSHVAVMRGHSLQMELYKSVRGMIPEQADLASMDEAEYLHHLEMALTQWPDDHLEMAVRIYEARHKLRLLGVSKSGTKG